MVFILSIMVYFDPKYTLFWISYSGELENLDKIFLKICLRTQESAQGSEDLCTLDPRERNPEKWTKHLASPFPSRHFPISKEWLRYWVSKQKVIGWKTKNFLQFYGTVGSEDEKEVQGEEWEGRWGKGRQM